jgi:hypothetical protein
MCRQKGGAVFCYSPSFRRIGGQTICLRRVDLAFAPEKLPRAKLQISGQLENDSQNDIG